MRVFFFSAGLVQRCMNQHESVAVPLSFPLFMWIEEVPQCLTLLCSVAFGLKTESFSTSDTADTLNRRPVWTNGRVGKQVLTF